MIESIALAITLGAILFHLNPSFGFITTISASIVLAGIFYFKTKRGFLYSCIIGASCMLGAVFLWYMTPDSIVFGKRIIHGTVSDIDTRLEKSSVGITSDTGESIRLQMKGGTDLLPGDSVVVSGIVKQPESFMTNTGRMFDYEGYLLARGVSGTMQNPTILQSVPYSGFSISRVSTKLRLSIARTFSLYVAFPIDGVIAGMVVGYQGGLTTDMQNIFKYTGTLHALVLSGYNVSLLAVILAAVLFVLPFRMRIILSGIAIFALVCISGAGVSAIRAGLMGGISLLGLFFSRTYNAWRALIVAYLLVFCISPFVLFYDPGFQLSFIASFFMIQVLPKVLTYIDFIPEKKFFVPLRELCTLGFVLPIFMLPYTMYFSVIVPTSSPFANIIVALVVPVLTILGIILLCVSWISPLAMIFGTLITILGNILVAILRFFNSFPIIPMPAISGFEIAGIYVLFCIFFFKKDLMSFWWQIQSIALRQTS